MKQISIDEHRELSRMKSGTDGQVHYTKLKVCHCEIYRKKIHEILRCTESEDINKMLYELLEITKGK